MGKYLIGCGAGIVASIAIAMLPPGMHGAGLMGSVGFITIAVFGIGIIVDRF